MTQEVSTAFAVVWIPGILLAFWVWKVSSAAEKDSRPKIGLRSPYLGVVFAPSVIHAHGDFNAPALFYSIYALTGDLVGAILYGFVPMFLTAILAYAVMGLAFF